MVKIIEDSNDTMTGEQREQTQVRVDISKIRPKEKKHDKDIKLKVKTRTENYPIIIGPDIIKNLNSYLNKNSIIFNKCLLVIDKNIPNRMISKITRSLNKKIIFTLAILSRKAHS